MCRRGNENAQHLLRLFSQAHASPLPRNEVLYNFHRKAVKSCEMPQCRLANTIDPCSAAETGPRINNQRCSAILASFNYCFCTRSSPGKYLAEFRESERKKSRLLQHDGDLQLDGGASNAILTAWQISFDHIR